MVAEPITRLDPVDGGLPETLDLDGVRAAAAPFGASRMLPAAAYLDPAVLAWERRALFDGWTCVGRSESVPAGTARAVRRGESGLLLVRDATGVLRAFPNACRHRGHELLAAGETSRPRALVCPYHAWTYALSGELLAAPGFRADDGFRPGEHGLLPMRLVEWQGQVFVDASGAAPPLVDRLRGLHEVVAPYGLDALVTAAGHEYVVAANWKVLIENYQECYHCSMIHPELCQVSPPDSGDNLEPGPGWVGGRLDLRSDAETMSFDGSSGGTLLPGLGERELHSVMYAAVLPNLLLSLHPDYVMSHLLVPLDVDHTAVTCSWAFARAAVERPGFDPGYAVDFWDLTNRQDWAACESVQRGLHSPGYRPGPLAPEEDGVHQFVRWMAERYLGAPIGGSVPTPPRPLG
jgi:Rieske 2Fe-2S family protein